MSNALERGLDVLEYLADRGPARVNDLTGHLGVSRATAFRLMVTLENRGYVEHVPDKHLWRLGPVVAELASTVDSPSIAQFAAPALADLRASTLETVNLAVLQRNRLVWAASVTGAHALRHTTVIGETIPIHATAVGKTLLSTLPDKEWPRLLGPEPFPQLTAHTRRTYAALAPDIEACRSSGWALDDEECVTSGVCVAAPILGPDDRAVAAISVSSVVGRLPDAEREPLGQALQRWSKQISADLREAPSH